MFLRVLKSGSSGNGYIIEAKSEALIIEAGSPLIEVKKAMNFNLRNICCLLVSHFHSDHSRHIKQYLDSGITAIAPVQVFEKYKIPLTYPGVKPISENKGIRVNSFKILPFPVQHDCECYGFHLSHPESGNIVFMTDTFMSEYKFKDVNHWMIEANYSDEILDEAIMSGRTHPFMRPRLMGTHMALSTTIELLKENDLSSTRNIVLLHLSDNNSNEEQFIQEIRGKFGKQVFAASQGLIVDFSKEPY